MIGFIGLSHLGIVTSIVSASKGFCVAAYDPDIELCDSLTNSKLPIEEPGLYGLLANANERITFSGDPSVLGNCELVYISQDVPTEDDGSSDLDQIVDLIDSVMPHLAEGTCMIVLSQVPPGFNRGLLKSLTDRLDGSVSLFHQVETLVFGQAVERAAHPERIIVGCLDTKALLPTSYASLLDSFECPILQMGYESAELAKISINAILASTVSMTNTLAELCEEIGGDWTEVMPALQMDRRIGRYAYIKPGLGLSGGNLERDLASIQSLANKFGTESSIVKACLVNSSYRKDWVLRILHSQGVSKNEAIGIWGIAYKADTDSTKNSPALSLIESLLPYSVQSYDPLASLDPSVFPNVTQYKSAIDACVETQVLIVMTPWSEFSSVDLRDVRNQMKGRIIIDPLKVLDVERCIELGFDHYRLGTSSGAPLVEE